MKNSNQVHVFLKKQFRESKFEYIIFERVILKTVFFEGAILKTYF